MNNGYDNKMPEITQYNGVENMGDVQNVVPIARVEGGGKSVDTVRAAMEVQAQVIMAHKFPRDEEAARNKVLSACQRKIFAEGAIYSYPKGKKNIGTDEKPNWVSNIVSGASIRMAEEIARNWGHINTGWGLVEQDMEKGYSDLMAYAWDLETGIRKNIGPFRVWHQRKTKEKTVKITDDRELYELQANQAQRRLRAAILAVLPSWVIEEALELVNRVRDDSHGADLPKTRQTMLEAFSNYNVTQSMLEKFCGAPVSLMTSRMMSELKGVYAAIKDGESNPQDFFEGFNTHKELERLSTGLVKEGIKPIE